MLLSNLSSHEIHKVQTDAWTEEKRESNSHNLIKILEMSALTQTFNNDFQENFSFYVSF